MAHGGHNCSHAHDHDESPEMGIQYSLYEKIDFENLTCLNESIENSGRGIFKSWEERLNFDKVVESDADEELLFNIPFTANIKLKGVIVIGEDSEAHPARLRIYKNRPNMTFDDISITPDQQFEMQRDTSGTLEYSTKVVKFSSVTHLTLHFPTNFGSENTKIYYIGLRGEFTTAHRHGVTICTYETTPNTSDHKTNAFDSVTKEIQ